MIESTAALWCLGRNHDLELHWPRNFFRQHSMTVRLATAGESSVVRLAKVRWGVIPIIPSRRASFPILVCGRQIPLCYPPPRYLSLVVAHRRGRYLLVTCSLIGAMAQLWFGIRLCSTHRRLEGLWGSVVTAFRGCLNCIGLD